MVCMISCIHFKARSTAKQYSSYPKMPLALHIVEHQEYVAGFDCNFQQSRWVYYWLSAKELKKECDRAHYFRRDSLIDCIWIQHNDYTNSCYDRGHLSPAEDNKASLKSMQESFLLSNVCPMLQAFNRGPWAALEEHCRLMATEYDSVLIITGPIWDSLQYGIIPNYPIPTAYYKLMYIPHEQNKLECYLLPHQAEINSYKNHPLSLDSLSKRSGIDFELVIRKRRRTKKLR